MREISRKILERRFGPIDPELEGLSKDKKGELFRRATKNKGRGKLHCSGKREDDVVPIKLTNSHGRAIRPRVPLRIMSRQEYEETSPIIHDSFRYSHKIREPLLVTIGEVVEGKIDLIRLRFEVDDTLNDGEQGEVSGLNATESQIPLPEIF